MARVWNRRGAMRWMLAASMGSVAAAHLRGSTATADNEPDFSPIRRRIQQSIAGGNAMGVAVAVVQGGRIVWEEGFGWATRETRLKATPNTPFGMASITKPFATSTLMTLLAEANLSLDQPANIYLAQSKLRGPNGIPAAATVRMLGAHVSGLPCMYESYEAGEARLVPSPDTLLKEYGRLAYPPGTCYEYSNLGYAALNAIALAASQTEFGPLMKRRLLDPLGLADSFFGADAARVSRSATRYDPLGRPIPHRKTSTPASGELYASAHDVATFLLFNMGNRGNGGASILSEASKAELHRPVFTGPSGIATTFGWFRGHTASGVPFLFKTGGDPGVANRVCCVPSKNLGCVVVTNQSNARELAFAVCDEVMTSYLPDWRRPDESCGFPGTALPESSVFQGRWRGVLRNDIVAVPVAIDVMSPTTASFALAEHRREPITDILAEGPAFTGVSTGRIRSMDVLRTGAVTLQIKLAPFGQRLVGRVSAIAGDPNVRNVSLPYVLRLSRVPG